MSDNKKQQKTQANSPWGSQDFGEAFDEKQAMNMMGQGGQQTSPTGNNKTDPAAQQALQQQLAGQMPATDKANKPRQVGSLKEELLTRPVKDIAQGLASIFDIKSILGINEIKDTPEEQMKKKQLHQRFNQLTQEEQQVAQQKYQQEMQKKKQEEEEKKIKKQKEDQAKAASIAPPSSPNKGPVGPGGSGKKRAEAKLEMDRKTLGGPSSVD